MAQATISVTVTEPELRPRFWHRVRPSLPLGLIVAGFLVLTVAYNVRVPLYEAPDEPGHVRYVDSLQRTGRSPGWSASSEAWQPPLYYALGAGFLKLLGRAAPVVAEVPNPDYSPSDHSDLRRYLHPEDNSFPYRGPVLSIHLLRGFTSLFGAGIIVMVYLTAMLLFPGRRLLALTAAASTALLPQFAFISASVNNEVPAALFAAAGVYFGLRFLKDGWWPALVLSSVAVALGVLTKSTALVAAVVPALALVLRPMPWSERLRGMALLAVLLLTATTRFYTRDVLAWRGLFPENPSPLSPLPLWDPAYRTVFLDLVLHSYWYLGGWMDVALSPILYNLLNLVGAVALAGVISFAISAPHSAFEKRGLLLLALLSLAALCAILYFSVSQDFQPQGRYLFVAQPALALFLALGLASLVRRDMARDHPAMLALPIILLGVNMSIFLATLPGAY